MSLFAFAWPRKRLVHIPTNGGRLAKPRPSVHLRLEALEERCTPAVHDLTMGTSFSTIQAAVNAANANDVIMADAGTYAENVTITKALTLEGADHGQNANTRFAAFTGGKADPTKESVLTAPTNNPLGDNPNANDLIRVLADGVTIDGFVIDGNNPALAGGTDAGAGGIAIQARRGVTNVDADGNFIPVNDLTVKNNIIQNLAQRGVSLDNNSTTASTGNMIANNVIRDFGSDPNVGGYGIILLNDAYADILNNTIIDDFDGATAGQFSIQVQNFDADGVMSILSNNITVHQNGVGVTVNALTAQNGVVNILQNTVNAAAGSTGTGDLTYGVYVSNVTTESTVTLTGNHIGSSGGLFSRGIDLWDLPTVNTVTVSGGSVANSIIGIDLDSVDIVSGAGDATTANVDGVTITGGTTGVAVRAITTNQLSPPPTTVDPTDSVVLNLTGLHISGATTGVLVQGFSPTITATATLVGNTITGATTGVQVSANGLLGAEAMKTTQNIITGNGTGIAVAAGAGTVQPIFDNNLSSNTGLAINNTSGTLVDASANWFGVNTPAGVAAKVSSNVDYSPFLDSGTNLRPMGMPGFTGNFSILDVAAASPQAGVRGRIQEGVNDVTAGGTVNVTAGTYSENVMITKDVTLAGAAGDPQTSIIQAAGGTGVAIAAPATTVTLKGLKITGAVTGITASGQTTLNLADLTLTGNTVSGGSVSNIGTLVYTPDGTTTAGTSATITATSFQRGTDQLVTFAAVPTFIVNGSPGPDTFDVTPNATTAFTIHGVSPSTFGPAPGDSLFVDETGTTTPTLNDTLDPYSGFSGSYTFGNRMAVNFDGIENLQGTQAPPSPPDDFSIAQNGNLYERNLAYDPSSPADGENVHIREISSGDFVAIAVTRDAATGTPVVFGILSNGTLWEHDLSFDPSFSAGTTDVHWRQISSGHFVSISATMDVTGTAGPVVFGVLANGNLWEHDLNFDPTLSAGANDVHWREISSGDFTAVSATQDLTGPNQGTPAVFGVLTNGNLWEHDLNFDPASSAGATDVHWREISSGHFVSISATTDATGTAGPAVFGVLTNGNLWEHDLNFDPASSAGATDVHWREISSGVFTSISATQDFSGANAGVPVVFGNVQGAGLYEHDLNFDPAVPAGTTDAHWREIASANFFSLSAAPDFTGTSAGEPALFGVQQNGALEDIDLNFDPASPPGLLNAHERMLSSSLFQSTSAG